MESSIAVFLNRRLAFELPPTYNKPSAAAHPPAFPLRGALLAIRTIGFQPHAPWRIAVGTHTSAQNANHLCQANLPG